MINVGIVKSPETYNFQTTLQKGRRQGARIMRKEAYLAYAAVTKDEAQRSIRPFYEVVINNPQIFNLEDVMDPKQIAKQIIAFNKAVFDNNFNAISSLHEQTEDLSVNLWKKYPCCRKKPERPSPNG